MATQTINWCTPNCLNCDGGVPASAYLCVNPTIVRAETSNDYAFIAATVTQARASTKYDSCGTCKYVYTITYDDTQLVDGFVLAEADIHSVLCNNCLLDFIRDQAAACWTRVSDEAGLIAANAAGISGVMIGGDIVLTDDIDIVVPMQCLPCGSIETDGNVCTITAPFTSSASQCFIASPGEVLFTLNAVDKVFPEWFGAVADDATDCTDALNTALASTRGVVWLSAGTYVVTGLTVEDSLTLQGCGWKSIIKNTSNTNHTIGRIGTANIETEAFKFADFAITHTGAGVTVDGLHLEGLNNHLRIERVRVDLAPRHGIYIYGLYLSAASCLYTRIEQVVSDGAGFDGVYLEGIANNATIIGGRFGSNGRYGLNVDDTTSGFPLSFPNTTRVIGTDLPGNDYGLHEAGHSNAYYGLRFESNITGDILFGTKSSDAMFFGSAYSGSIVINGTPTTKATFYDKAFAIRQNEADGFFDYWDSSIPGIRRAPKRSVYNVLIPSIAASGVPGTTNTWPISRVQDDVTIVRVSIIPDTAITGANINYMNLQLRVKKAGGGDSAIASIDFTLGVDAAQYEDVSLTVNPLQEDREDGDVLYFSKYDYGTGMTNPEFAVQVEYSGRS